MVTLTFETKGKLVLSPPKPAEVQLACNRAAAEFLTAEVKQNFTSLPGRDFYADAAFATRKGKVTAEGAEVTIAQPGVHLQWKGGTVKPTGKPSEVTGMPTKNLLVPVGNSELKKKRGVTTLGDLKLPKESVHIVKAKNGKVYLIADKVKHIKRRKGVKAHDRESGVMLGRLVKHVTIPPHPNVMPTEADMLTDIRTAAAQQLRSMKWQKKG